MQRMLSGFRSRARRAAAAGRSLRMEPLEPRIALSGAGLADFVPQPSGALDGKIVFTSGGHGWQWSDALNRWATDRGDNNEIVEDFGNQDQMTFFSDHLLRAGATVVPMRPVGHQVNEVVLDNDSPDVTYAGAWSNSTSSVYYDEDYGAVADSVSYRFSSISATETATATYTPNIPEAGFYPVYTWVLDSNNRTDQLYRIHDSAGGVTEVRVDHRMVGKGWVYLGTYHFDAGTSGSVVVSNQSTAGGSSVIADAIRFGNGMGDMRDGPNGVGHPSGTISGEPREDENALMWTWRAIGQGNSAAGVIGTSHVSAPHRMAEHMNANSNPFGTSVYIGFHSNAGGGRGAVGLIDQNFSDQTPNQPELALFTGRQINQDMQSLNGLFEHNWSTRTTHTFSSSFGEIDLGQNAEMDATIIETAFHDSALDAELMRDPKVRDQLARSTYEAVIEYFANFGGLTDTVSQPSAPTGVTATTNANGDVTISWQPGPTGAQGGTPTAYRVYVSRDGYGFSGYDEVAGAGAGSHTFAAGDLDDDPYYFKVVAVNSGGESPRSAVTTARKSDPGEKRVLIVDGFDRNERAQNERYPYLGGGLTDRVRTRFNNSFDYVVQIGEALTGVDAGFNAVQNEAVISGAATLSDYDAVIWFLGEESSADSTFDFTEQTLVANYLAGGGKLFVSGAEIAWDLDFLNNGRAFYEATLHGNYVSDDAATYNVTGTSGSIFDGLSFSFDNGSQFYDVNFPDVIGGDGVGGEQILDNDDGAPVYSETGSWSTAGGVGYNGGTYRFAPADAAPATAQWEFFAPFAGQGEVFVQYVAGSNRTSSTHYEINTGNGTEVATISQKSSSLTWVSLGTFDFTEGTHQVVLDAGASTDGSVVIADAVRVAIDQPTEDTADFDDDGDRDGRDFLAWQRGFGSGSPTQADGDGNNDGNVDSADRGIWESQFGTDPTAAVTLTALNYSGGTGGGAAIQYDSGGSTKVVIFGFPFETIADAALRDAVMGRVMEFFDFTLVPVVAASVAAADGGLDSVAASELDSGALTAIAQRVADQRAASVAVRPTAEEPSPSPLDLVLDVTSAERTSQPDDAGIREPASAVADERSEDDQRSLDDAFTELVADEHWDLLHRQL